MDSLSRRRIFIEHIRLIFHTNLLKSQGKSKNIFARAIKIGSKKNKKKKEESKRRHAPVKNTRLVQERSDVSDKMNARFPRGKGGFYLSVDKSL